MDEFEVSSRVTSFNSIKDMFNHVSKPLVEDVYCSNDDIDIEEFKYLLYNYTLDELNIKTKKLTSDELNKLMVYNIDPTKYYQMLDKLIELIPKSELGFDNSSFVDILQFNVSTNVGWLNNWSN